MTTLTVTIHNEEEEKALLAFLDNRNYEYEESGETDTTDYLLATDAMKTHLGESIRQANEGKVSSIPLDDLWK